MFSDVNLLKYMLGELITRSNFNLFSRSKVFKLIFGTRSNYFSFFTRSKDFGTGLKVLKAKNTIIRTFDLVPKKKL